MVASGRVLVVEADGGSRGNPGPAGYGALVREGESVLAERAEYLGECSNNVAEYSGLIAGLRAAARIDPTAQVEVRMDSRLVVEQMSGRWKIKHADMRRLADEARAILPAGQVTYTWVPRAENGAADALANAVMDSRGTIATDHTDGAPPPGSAGPVDSSAVTGDPLPADSSAVTGDPLPADSSVVTGSLPASSDDDDDEEPPVPDVDTEAPSLADPDAITLVLVSPGWTPRDGEEDPELTDEGMELAGAAAAVVDTIGFTLWPHLARPSVLLASPLVRAQQTAELISEVADLGIPTVDDDFAAAAPGESRAEVAVRVERALARLDETCGGCTVVVAAHADVIAAVIGTVVEAPTEAWDVFRIAPGTISVVRRWSGRGEVHVMGCPAQLVGTEVG
ncbi:histidine phosphatase family protein [Actinomycetaceae bacterium Sa1BUA1]|uniref:Histidine phosphatase family protein n=1 Tax=Oceanitalea stevensii TaxID=2763072 RepID=A0ABR8YYP0_9MICO|nr:histidine phosphatase family protein [Oceanitalea stevensii]MBD8060913.1 histidine phosphatase family protein [Oceanitalea stevensii]